VLTNFFCAIILMWYTWNIYFFFFFINWTLRMSDNLPKEFQSWVTRISFALLYGKTEFSAVKYIAICSKNLLLSGFLMLCSWF
jgi:cellobiose-specific phosphotransferase system component IIC